ncbi:hypothetical protein [Jatrophihabitans sp.]|jgi:hypothetical protein|uniref:hypothetical protein n=1 Tax=Jatrophihabitans sp. TaxID=1932789 RepID=UPI002F152E42
MALSEEEHSKLTEVERELAADQLLASFFAFAAAEPGRPRSGPGRRMRCSRARRRR